MGKAQEAFTKYAEGCPNRMATDPHGMAANACRKSHRLCSRLECPLKPNHCDKCGHLAIDHRLIPARGCIVRGRGDQLSCGCAGDGSL